MIAILGGLGAAAAWAISTLCSSRSSRLIDPMSVVAWVMLTGLVICLPLAAASGVPSALGGHAGAWLALSGAGNVGGLLLAYRALRIGRVSLVAPLVSTEGAVAAVIALLAGERLRVAVGAGLGLAVIGVCLAAVPTEAREDRRRSGHPEAVALAILAALSFGVSLYATARASSSLPASWVVLSARLIGVLALALPLAAARRLRLTRAAVPLVLGSGVCEVVGFFSYTAGARHGLAVAAVLASQFAALAALVAFLAFGERLGRVQLAGVGTVLLAVSLLSGVSA